MNNPRLQAIEALRSISRNEEIKAYLIQNRQLYKIALKAARRFIGGETLDECFQTTKVIIKKGHSLTIDFMGESTRDKKTADQSTEEFLRIIQRIRKTECNASISLDLSHIGMMIDKKLGLENATKLAQKAQQAEIEMMISMEGIDRIDDILESYNELSKDYGNVGITLQAYLHRTKVDLEEILKKPGRIRLLKGAYKVSARYALPLGKDTDKVYKKYAEKILLSKHLSSIATHDEKLISNILKFIKNKRLSTNLFEFEMLHGATPELLDKLHTEGFQTREYLPYGEEWYLYFCHRLAENPQNIYQALVDAIGN